MLNHSVNVALSERLEARHQAITATYQGGHNLLRLAAIEPVVIGQVGEAITALSVGTMAHCTVIEKNALGYLHGLGIVSQLRNRDFLVLGEDRREALLGASDFLLPLSLLGPAEQTCKVAQAGVEQEVAQRKNHGADIELEPPAGQRVVVFFDFISRMPGGFHIAVGIGHLIGFAVCPKEPESKADGAQ